ncbi:hypothetical protein ALT1000_110117 [Alteromonas macleodii]
MKDIDFKYWQGHCSTLGITASIVSVYLTVTLQRIAVCFEHFR